MPKPAWQVQSERYERRQRVDALAHILGLALDPPGLSKLVAALTDGADRAALAKVLTAKLDEYLS